MHERARCLWRGNLLRIENRSPSLAWLSPPSALAKTAERRVAGKKRKGRKCRGRRQSRPKRTGEGGCRGKALAHWGDWVSGWLRKLAKKAERKGQAPCGAVRGFHGDTSCCLRWALAGSFCGASSATTWLPSSVRRKNLMGCLGPVCHHTGSALGTVLRPLHWGQGPGRCPWNLQRHLPRPIQCGGKRPPGGHGDGTGSRRLVSLWWEIVGQRASGGWMRW